MSVPKPISLEQSDKLHAAMVRPSSHLEPQALIALAIEKGAPIDTVERMVALAKDVRAVTAREAFFSAMAEFKRKCPPITKDAVANTGRYSYRYATLNSILETVQPALTDLGLTISWKQKHEGQAVHASCVITHRLGHQEESGFIAMPFDAAGQMNPAQRVGSAATYAKRYSLLAVLGIAPEDDDDAQGSHALGRKGEPRTEASSSASVREPSAATPTAHYNPDDPAAVEESEGLFQVPEQVKEREDLERRIGKQPPARVTIIMRRLELGDGDWRKLDLAALNMLANHLDKRA